MTITRASRRGAYTLPVEHGRPRTPKAGQQPVEPDWDYIIRLAKQQRTEEAITAYAQQRRTR